MEPEFDGITNLSKYNILLIKDEKFGNYNSSLKKLIYPKYTSLLKPIGENYYAFFNNNKYGVIDVNGKDQVAVGRIRQDISNENSLELWLCGDQSRKGAARNAIQMAELLLPSK